MDKTRSLKSAQCAINGLNQAQKMIKENKTYTIELYSLLLDIDCYVDEILCDVADELENYAIRRTHNE